MNGQARLEITQARYSLFEGIWFGKVCEGLGWLKSQKGLRHTTSTCHILFVCFPSSPLLTGSLALPDLAKSLCAALHKIEIVFVFKFT